MKKKIMVGTIAIIVVGLIFMQIFKVNGNPIKKIQAKKEFESFINENYKGTDYKLGEVHYEYFEGEGRYIGKVVSEKEGIYFDLDYFKDVVTSGKGDGTLADFELIDRFSKKIESDIKEGLYEKVSFSDIDKYTKGNNHMFVTFKGIPQGKYMDRSIVYSRDMDDEFSISINIEDDKIKNNREYLNNLAKDLKEIIKKQDYKGLTSVSLYIRNISGQMVLEISKDSLLRETDFGNKIIMLD